MKKPLNKRERHQRMIRALAIVLVVVLIGGILLTTLVSAFAEESAPNRDCYELNIEYLEDEQALHVSQRLVYHNPADQTLDSVVFYAAGNMFRRESALMYENDVLESIFPNGYAPAGIELQSVRVDGEDAHWGYRGQQEMQLRVSCTLAPGSACTFEFDYYLLLSECGAMIGVSETDIRLSAFYFIPALYIDGDFYAYSPLQFTRWVSTNAADYTATITLSDQYLPAATGTQTLVSSEDRQNTWRFEAQNVREFALSFGRRYRESTRQTASGVTVRVLANDRSGASQALEYAVQVIELYETWLGDFPMEEIDLVQSDYPVDALNFPGVIWLPEDVLGDRNALRAALRFCLAQQYLGFAAYAEPVSDAWLSDVPCAYLSLLAVEELEGHNAFLTALNDQVLTSLNMTVPGGLYITAAANLFSAEEYDVIVINRGTVVMHELRTAMGLEAFLESMRCFYQMGASIDVLGEYDFVAAFDSVTGGDWEDFITEWLFNVDEYIDQQLEYYE